jgi:hypothetical protein
LSGVGSRLEWDTINGRKGKEAASAGSLLANCQKKIAVQSKHFFSWAKDEFNCKTVNWVSVFLPLTRISLLSFAWGRLTE